MSNYDTKTGNQYFVAVQYPEFPSMNLNDLLNVEARGAYQTDYAPGTLRNKLLGNGDRLAEEHRGASYRVGGRNSTITERPSTLPSSSASTAAQPARGM